MMLKIEKPSIFKYLENLNNKYIKLEKEIKQKSEIIKLEVEEMKKKLKNIEQFQLRYDNNNATYYGEVKRGHDNGLGIWIWDKGDKYEGEFFDGNFDGIGITYLDDGIYFGEFRNGNLNGFGVSTLKSGRLYEGDWINGRATGIGITTLENGLIYIGQTKDAAFSGTGKFIYANGNYFIGSVYEGGRNGLTYFSNEQGIFDAKYEYNEALDQSIGIGIFYFLNGMKQERKRIIKGKEKPKWEYL